MRARMVGIGGALALIACVDGTTPDCSDAAATCGPSLDGTMISEASPVDAHDGSSDAPDDADDARADSALPSDAGWDARDAAGAADGADAADARG